MLYGSKDVFPGNDDPFEVRTMVTIFGEVCPQKPSNMGVNRQFQPKRQNIKIAISQKL